MALHTKKGKICGSARIKFLIFKQLQLRSADFLIIVSEVNNPNRFQLGKRANMLSAFAFNWVVNRNRHSLMKGIMQVLHCMSVGTRSIDDSEIIFYEVSRILVMSNGICVIM